MYQLHHQFMPPALCVGGTVAHLQGDHQSTVDFAIAKTIVIEQQVPEPGETVHCVTQ
ncbi:hypothetical protein D3C87_1967210 [compost metagenome]